MAAYSPDVRTRVLTDWDAGMKAEGRGRDIPRESRGRWHA